MGILSLIARPFKTIVPTEPEPNLGSGEPGFQVGPSPTLPAAAFWGPETDTDFWVPTEIQPPIGMTLAGFVCHHAARFRSFGTPAADLIARTLDMLGQDIADFDADRPETYWSRLESACRVEAIEARAERTGRHPYDPDGLDGRAARDASILGLLEISALAPR